VGKPARIDEQAAGAASELMRVAGADFAELGKTDSDDAMAKQTGGVRDNMPPTSLPPDWQKAVAPLKPGQVAPEPIKDATGYTIVKLEKVQQQLPQDFEKNKQKELDRLASEKQSQAWNQYQQELRAKAKVQVVDPEMLAYEAILPARWTRRSPNCRRPRTARRPWKLAGAASVYYQLANYYALRKQVKDGGAYESADSYLARGERTERAHGDADGDGAVYQNMGNTGRRWSGTERRATPRIAAGAPAADDRPRPAGSEAGRRPRTRVAANYSKQQAEQLAAQQAAIAAQQSGGEGGRRSRLRPSALQAGRTSAQTPGQARSSCRREASPSSRSRRPPHRSPQVARAPKPRQDSSRTTRVRPRRPPAARGLRKCVPQ
jgi:hypothetical protein